MWIDRKYLELVSCPDQHDIEPSAAGTSAADAVIDILLDDLKAALLGHLL